MQLIIIFLGAVVGYWFAEIDEVMLGLVGGGAIGYVLAKLRDANRRIQALERRSPARTDTGRVRRSEAPASFAVPPVVPSTSFPTPPPSPLPSPVTIATTEPGIAWRETAAPIATRTATGETAIAPTGAPNSIDKLIAMAKDWLTTGNVPVKLGIIVSFFGVAFLLRYAVDNELLVVPIQLRYLMVAGMAIILLIFGWRLRESSSVYALSLQGGGIGILYLTIFSAFRLHPLLPPSVAFVLLVALTAFAGMLAVLQNAKALSILGVVGGFLAPVLISTGSGNHVALFSYYLLLNCAVLGIAWFKTWRGLNVIGFVFTFGVAALWGNDYYRPELFSSTEPFLVTYFLFYQAIAILFAFRQPPNLRGLVDGTLIFGTPVIAFALQSQLVDNTEYGLAISALALSAFYVGAATWIHRKQGNQMRLLVESFIALGIAFGTIAIPLALDSRWTAVAWAMEGAALVWVGVRQHGILAKLTGTALLGASGIAYIDAGWNHASNLALLNGNFLGGMLISLSSLFASRYLSADDRPSRLQSLLSTPLLLWGLGWWGVTGSAEIIDQVGGTMELHAVTAFIAVSVALLAWVARRYDWLVARRATLAFLPLMPILALAYLWEHQHVFAGFGTLSWLVAITVHFGLLRAYDNGQGKLEGFWHLAGGLLIAVLLSQEIYWRLDHAGFAETWAVSAALLAPLLVAGFILFQRDAIAWPLQRYDSAYLAVAGVLVAVQLLTMAGAGINHPTDPSPLPYIPILNPFDLLSAFGLLIALKTLLVFRSAGNWLAGDRYRSAMLAWGVAAFILSTIAVVRATHHLGDIVWRPHALFQSVQVQSALSIYWAALGFGGMVWGARNARRWVWIAGASLMVIVVLKLFFVDFGNTGTVARIVSFIGVGGLLVVVGYFAPAPPKLAVDEAVAE